jgi:dimethylhistidine N-methyltransferase
MEARHAETIESFDDSFARGLSEGLRRAQKEIPCKYFYDAEGSALFEAICALPEYYQTRTEVALLRRHAAEIAGLIGARAEIVEFGAGSARKVRILLDALESPHGYSPIDISGAYLRGVVQRLAADYPRLRLAPLAGDFTLPLQLPALAGAARRAGFFPGGTIGNFTPDAAMALLRRMREMLGGGGLLVGVDLVKDPALLHAAYNDAAGITAAFNKNLLARANRELAADFDLDAFAHYAPYNPKAQRIEMYLVSLKRQSARLPDGMVEFSAGEAIHTEDSHKYSIESFREIAARAGFSPRAVWTDENRLFSLHWLEAR